jgi:SAM-dependent methyltransferase
MLSMFNALRKNRSVSSEDKTISAVGRYLGNTADRLDHYRSSATEYPMRLSDEEALGLFTKPFDRARGHASFFYPMYQLLNMLRVLDLPPWARIVEVGAGSGWVTEVLVGLGYIVEAVEPSSRMIAVSQERIKAFREKHKFSDCIVHYHESTFEGWNETNMDYDAILFYESLHHLADERTAMAKAFHILKPGGVIGIIGESNWRPGDIEQERFLDQEIERFGTLESPFTFQYLLQVLTAAGFVQITRYHGVNGFFAVDMEMVPIKDVADLSASNYNNVVARKPQLPRNSDFRWRSRLVNFSTAAADRIRRILDR